MRGEFVTLCSEFSESGQVGKGFVSQRSLSPVLGIFSVHQPFCCAHHPPPWGLPVRGEQISAIGKSWRSEICLPLYFLNIVRDVTLSFWVSNFLLWEAQHHGYGESRFYAGYNESECWFWTRSLHDSDAPYSPRSTTSTKATSCSPTWSSQGDFIIGIKTPILETRENQDPDNMHDLLHLSCL